ncbi:hypothetical protein MHB65_22120 [Lysinibacillus sp. FSL K6-0075]|uniref:hypothetical protein n=1 Tax=Lysinibacillus sp. FSL K6-0075 TaxID=2921415 RepID=UPI003158D13A
MSNDLGLVWGNMLKQLDVNDLQWLSDSGAFDKRDNKVVQDMNEMLSVHLEEMRIGVN